MKISDEVKNVGILTFYFSNNYGALLQAYALSNVLRQLGYNPVFINRVPDSICQTSSATKFKLALNHYIQSYFRKSFSQFRNQFLGNATHKIDNEVQLKRVADKFDAVIVGSDQVWRIDYTKRFSLNFFLDFVPDSVRKISYAASFGNDKFSGDAQTTIKVKELLSRFYAISVREESGVVICKDIFNVNAEHLLDPTMILPVEEYDSIINQLKHKISGEFITQYLLDHTPEKKRIVETVASKIGVRVNNIHRESLIDFSTQNLDFDLNKYKFPTFGAWLSGIKNANFVVTDSFHGVAFSILFNKQFICIANKNRGIARMSSLLKLVGLEDRLIFENDSFVGVDRIIDYTQVNLILEIERIKSKKFILGALSV